MSSIDLGSIVAHLKLEMGEFTNSLNVAQDEIKRTSDKFRGIEATGKTMQKTGLAITTGVTVPMVALGKSVIQYGSQFESAMNKLKAMSGATNEEMVELEKVARDYGKSTAYSASETADALGFMALAGWTAKESIAGLPGVLSLASAGEMELAEASSMVTDYLSAFGLEADQAGRMADVLAKAGVDSSVDVEQLGESFKNCAANSNAFGLDIEQTTALLGKLADQGLKGSEAGTTLSAMFRDITAKMEKGAITIGKTSVKVTDANGNYRDMTDILKDVEKATDGMGEAERNSALMRTFTSDSIKGMNMLLNEGSGSIEEYEEALRNSGGTADKIAKQLQDDLGGDVDNMTGAFEELCIIISKTVLPAFRGFIQGVTKVIQWLTDLPQPVLYTIIAILGLIAILGPIIVIFGTLFSSIGSIIGGFKLMVTAFGGIKTGFLIFKSIIVDTVMPVIGTFVKVALGGLKTGFFMIKRVIMTTLIPALSTLWGFLLANPIVLIIGLIALLVGGFIWAWNNMDGFKEFWIDLWTKVRDWLNETGDKIVDTLSKLPGQIWKWLVSVYDKVTKWASQMITKGINVGTKFVSSVVSYIASLPGKVWSWLLSTINKVGQFVVKLGLEGLKSAKTFITNITRGLANLPSQMVTVGKNIVSGIIRGIGKGASNLFNTLRNLASDALSSARNALGINSPSKVFANNVGNSIPEGISLGIKANTKPLLNNIKDLSNQLVGVMDIPSLGGMMDSLNIKTSDVSVKTDNTLLSAINNLTSKLGENGIDYDRMTKGFQRAVTEIDSTIVMDKTVVGRKTASTVKTENTNKENQLRRFRGELDYV